MLDRITRFAVDRPKTVIGLVFGHRWSEAVALITGISSFVLGLIIAKLINNLLARRALFLPKIVNIVEKQGS